MFWIGMIVGAITLILVCLAYLAYCCKVCQVDRNEFREMTDVIETAILNRESQIQVWHNDELLDVTTLKEK